MNKLKNLRVKAFTLVEGTNKSIRTLMIRRTTSISTRVKAFTRKFFNLFIDGSCLYLI